MHKRKWWVLRSEADAGDGGGSGGGDAGSDAGNAGGDAGNQGASGDSGQGSQGGQAGDASQGNQGGSQGAGNDSAKDESQKGYWPDDWLSKVSKGDEKLAKQLGRYSSPEALAEALVAAQAKIRSGELKAVLPKNASPEQLAEWRKENGIPEAPDKYDLKFDSGLVIGDEDKPVIDAYLKTAHAKNLTPEQVRSNIEWYYEEQKRQTDARYDKDLEESDAAQEALREEWGPNYKRHINMVDGLISKLPESVREAFKGARLPDGTGVFNHPDILRGFAALALELDPAGTLAPAGGGDPSKNINGEIETIEKTMRENRSAYNKDEKMQARYRELLAAREKLQKRAA